MPAVAEPPAEPTASPVAPSTVAKSIKMGDAFRSKLEPTAPVIPDPPEPAKTEPKPAPASKPDEPKSNKELQFKKLNDDFDNFRKTSTAKQQELEKALAEKETVHAEAIKAETTKREQYEQIVKRLALEHDPKFKAEFDRKIDAAALTVKEAVGSEHREKIEKLLKMPPSEMRDEQLELLTEGLSEFKKMRLTDAYNKLGEVQRQRQLELDNAAHNIEALDMFRQQETMAKTAEKRQFRENVFQDQLAKFSSVLPDFKDIDGDTEHNAIAAKTRQDAKDWLTLDLDDADMAKLALWAAKGKNSVQTDALRNGLIAKLQAQVAELSAAQPGFRGGGSPTNKSNKPLTAKERAGRYSQAMQSGIPDKQAA